MRLRSFVFLPLVVSWLMATAVAQQPQHLFFRVTLGVQAKAAVSGRVLVFLTEGTGAKEVDDNPFSPKPIYVAAKEVTHLEPGASVDVDTDDLAYPQGFSTLKPGDYQAQAVLDTQHTYDYAGRAAGDLISSVIPLKNWTAGQGDEPSLVLSDAVPERAPRVTLTPEQETAAHAEDFVSPVLSKFFGRPVHMRAWVIVPPGYENNLKERYLTAYWTH